MGCPPVRGDNPRALASGLSYEQVDKHGITILYYLHQCRPCTSRDISCESWQGWYKKTSQTLCCDHKNTNVSEFFIDSI